MEFVCTNVIYPSEEVSKKDLPSEVNVEISNDYYKIVKKDEDELKEAIEDSIAEKTGVNPESFDFKEAKA